MCVGVSVSKPAREVRERMDYSKEWANEAKIVSFSSSFHQYVVCFLLAIIVALKLTKRGKSKTKQNLPPSPKKLPIIGNLHQIGTLPYRSFRALSQKHGDLMWLQLGKIQAIVVSSADLAKEIMKFHDKAFSNRHQTTAVKTLLYDAKDVGFSSYGENWKLKRKICVLELLNNKRVHSFNAIRIEEVAGLLNNIRKASLSGACVNLSELLTETTNNIISKCVLGQKNEKKYCYSKVKELSRKVMIQLAVLTLGDYFPFLGWVDVLSGQIQEFKSSGGALDALFDQAIAEHKRVNKESDHPSGDKDFVDILIQVQEDSRPDFDLTNVDIKAILMDMFTAGSDTSASTLEWAMAGLMSYPMKLKKAQEEVRRIVGNKSKIEENDINQMNYMKCVIKETLRLYPPAPLFLPRETSSSVKLRGYDIPAKTVVYVNAWAIQRDPQFWERPEEFIPERHDNTQLEFKDQDCNFFPFGFGRRVCPGMAFGLTSVEYILSNLLCWFDWNLPPTHTHMDMTETYGLVTSKKVPLHLKPTPASFQSQL